MSRRIVMGLAVLFLAAPVYATASAQASTNGTASDGATVTNSTTDTPISGYAYNSCNNEQVYIVGMEHVTRVVVTDTAGTRVMYHLNFSDSHGTGVTTGAKYVLGATEKEVDVFDGSAGSQDFMLNEQLVGQGQTPNMGLHMLQTFSWDGSHVSVSSKGMTATCN